MPAYLDGRGGESNRNERTSGELKRARRDQAPPASVLPSQNPGGVFLAPVPASRRPLPGESKKSSGTNRRRVGQNSTVAIPRQRSCLGAPISKGGRPFKPSGSKEKPCRSGAKEGAPRTQILLLTARLSLARKVARLGSTGWVSLFSLGSDATQAWPATSVVQKIKCTQALTYVSQWQDAILPLPRSIIDGQHNPQSWKSKLIIAARRSNQEDTSNTGGHHEKFS